MQVRAGKSKSSLTLCYVIKQGSVQFSSALSETQSHTLWGTLHAIDGILPRGPKNFPRLSHPSVARIALFDLSLLVGASCVPTGLRCFRSGVPKLRPGRIWIVNDDEFSLAVLAEDRRAGREKGRHFFKKQNWPPIVPETYNSVEFIFFVAVCGLVVIDKGVLGGGSPHGERVLFDFPPLNAPLDCTVHQVGDT